MFYNIFFYNLLNCIFIDSNVMLVYAQDDDEFIPKAVLYETPFDESRRQRFWNYLQDERRTIFDRYDPAYVRDSFHLAEKWGVLSQGRIEEIEEEEVAMNYELEQIFENTAWHPGYIADTVEVTEAVKDVREIVFKVMRPTYDFISSYIGIKTLVAFSLIGFVGGTMYIGYLAEQGHFDWLDVAQAEIDKELKLRWGVLYDIITNRGGPQPPSND
jgi:hypothetical protein